ncbi:MAG: M42 family metallopeptidase [Anaerolineae bacterium]
MRERLKAEILADLRALTALDGVSGHEEAVIAAVREALAPVSDAVVVDSFGNVIADANGAADGYRLLLAAHSDEIGLLVKSISSQGYLRFDILAGAQPALLPGRLVRVNGSIMGVIGVKSGHLQREEERGRVPSPADLYIDVGADSAAAVAALGIRIGDPVAFHSPLTVLSNPDLVAGKAIDDRLGCAVLLATMRRLARSPHRTTVTCAITTQEEVGARGAAVVAQRCRPDCAVAVDTFMSGDTPDVDFEKEMPVAIGQGPVLMLASGGTYLGSIMHPAMRRLLERAATATGIAYQRAIVLATPAFTDAAAIQRSGEGVPVGNVSLARRYSHSPVCTANLNDAVGAVLWLESLVHLLDTPDAGGHPRPSLAFLEE